MKLGPDNLRNVLLAGFLVSLVIAVMAFIVGISKTQTGDGWLSLCGSVFGGMITLGAGILAWHSIQGQIELAAADAKQQSDAALKMARAHGENILEFCDVSIRILTQPIESEEELKRVYSQYEEFCREEYETICKPLEGDVSMYAKYIPLDLLRSIRIADARADRIFFLSQNGYKGYQDNLSVFVEKFYELKLDGLYIYGFGEGE